MTNLRRRIDAVVAAFVDRAGRAPEGVWCAPGRVNLLGEHTDYNEGFVLPAAINREVVAAVGLRGDALVRCWSAQKGEAEPVKVDEIGPGRVEGWAAYPLGVVWALREADVPTSGVDIFFDSDVPMGGGLSSSAAMEGAIAVALTDLHGVQMGRTELALAGRRAETEVVGARTGVMDQMAALHGGSDCAVFIDCRSLLVEQIELGLARAELTLVVLDTRVAHAHVDNGYGNRRRACEQAAALLGVRALRDVTLEEVEAAADRLGDELLRRARHVVTENERVLRAVRLLRGGKVDRLGSLFAASHASMRDDFELSVPELDLAVETALGGGATAARMTGGGFGGAAVAVAPAAAVERIAADAARAFAARGFGPPDVFSVTPSDGARRLQ